MIISKDELLKENIQLKQSLETLFINFNKLSQKLIHSSDLDETLDALFDLCADIFPHEEIGVFLLKQEFELERYRNLPDESYMEITDIQEEEIFDWVILQNKKIVLKRKYKKGSYILLPLTIRNNSIGIMLLGTSLTQDELTLESQDILSMISAQVAVAIDNSRLYSSLEDKNRKLDNIKNYMGNIIQSFNEGIIVIDSDYTVTTMNEAAENYLSITKKQMMLKNIKSCMNNWMTPIFFEKIDNALKSVSVTNHTVDLDNKYLKFFFIPLMGIHKNIIGIIIHIEDMTTSIELERLKEIDDFKNQIISNVSHELKTPLTSIKAYTETIIDMVKEEKSVKDKKNYIEFLSVISSESERLLNIIVDILDTSKLESGKVNLNLTQISIKDIIDRIVTGLEGFIKEKNIIIEKLYSDEQDYIINIDQTKIEQVFYNIISNAIKYNVKEGKIIFDIKKTSKNIVITVKDTGVGIDKKNLKNVFDKFFREDTEATKEAGGFGLGLNIVKNIIMLHKGKINIDSIKDKGTEIIIKLPL
ncbi:MAG: ATP-binding protein [Candidatus Muirbacterium halophilum]|nr:ATP-binding protein [Candidatus Muirbacterium halophilum]